MSNSAILAAADDAKIADTRSRALLKIAGTNADEPDDDTGASGRIIPGDSDPGGIGGAPPLNPLTLIPVLVQGTMTRDALTAVAPVNSFIGGVATLLVPATAIPGLLAVTGVTRLGIAPVVSTQLDESVPTIGANRVWQGPPPTFGAQGFTGRGVIFGPIDTGIDVTHPDFTTAPVAGHPNGVTRLTEAWDMKDQTGVPPTGYTYGSKITKATIQTDLDALTAAHLVDTAGHGTAMASCAVGNGRGAGTQGDPAYRYPGCAPEADLIVVKLPDYPTVANVIDAATYLIARAGALAKPLVLYFGAGTREGGHDGSNVLDTAVAAMIATPPTAYSVIGVAPAGNEANVRKHVRSVKATVDATVVALGTAPTARITRTPIVESLWLQGWIADDAQFTIGIDNNIAGFTTRLNATNGQEVTVLQNGISVRIQNATQTINGKRKVDVYISNPDPTLAGGIIGAGWSSSVWEIYMTRTGGTSSVGAIDWYLVASTLSGERADNVNWSTDTVGLTTASTITSPGTCANVVCVGGNQHNGTYVDADGVLEDWNYQNGPIANFSGKGPVLGAATILPDVVAPCELVVCAVGAGQTPFPYSYSLDHDQIHAERDYLEGGGTSVAAALVAGCACLLLHKVPSYTGTNAKAYFKTLVTVADVDTGSLPNNTYGAGKFWAGSITDNAVSVDPLPIRDPIGGGGPGIDPQDPPIQRVGDTGRHPKVPNGLETGYIVPAPSSALPGDTYLLEVFDPTGAVVYSAQGTDYRQVAHWKGQKSDGSPAPRGRYHAQLRILNRNQARSITADVY